MLAGEIRRRTPRDIAVIALWIWAGALAFLAPGLESTTAHGATWESGLDLRSEVHLELKALHDPPPIFLELDLRGQENELKYRLLFWAEIYREIFGFDEAEIAIDPKAELKRRAEAIADWMDKRAPVFIDGVQVRPRVVQLETHVNDVQNVQIFLRYDLPVPPKRVRYLWPEYVIMKSDEYPLHLPSIRSFFNDSHDLLIIDLRAEEPEYTWHAPPPESRAPSLEVIADRLKRQSSTPKRIPALSLGLVLAGVLLAGVSGFFGASLRLRASLVVIGCALAIPLRDRGILDLDLGQSGSQDATPISEADARDLFRSLHAQVYRAFGYETEAAVYDTLERAVTPELLDPLYDQIYRSLISREDGGAIARVEAVKLGEVKISWPKEREEQKFSAECDWIVTGVVEHSGHSHVRRQQYQARYEVLRRSGDWRLAKVEILSQERLAEDE